MYVSTKPIYGKFSNELSFTLQERNVIRVTGQNIYIPVIEILYYHPQLVNITKITIEILIT
jgi:hypothetical protein